MQRLKSPGYLSWLLVLICCALLPLISSAVLFSLTQPALTSRYSVTPKLPFLVCVVGLALFCWTLEQVRQRRLMLRHPWLCLLIALFLVWSAVSCVFSISPVASFFGTTIDNHGLLLYLACGALAFLALQHITSTKRLIALAQALVASGAAVALVALIQSCYVQWSSRPLQAANPWVFLQGGAVLGNPDFVAAFLGPLCLLAVGLVLTESRVWIRLAWGVALCLMGAAVVVAQSRATYLAVLCAALFLLVIVLVARHRAKEPQTLRWKTALVAVLCALGLGLAVVGAQLPTLRGKLLPTTTQTINTYSGSRLTFWGQALEVIAARPLTGTGPDLYQKGAYPFVTKVDDPQTGGRVYVDDPHSYPLMLTATLGLPALLILLVLGAISLRTLGRTLRQKSLGQAQLIYLVFWSALLTVGIACCFGNANIAVTMTVVAIGAAVLAATDQKPLQKEGALLPALIALLSLALLVAGTVFAVRPLVADYYLGRFQQTNSEPALQKAVNTMPWDFGLQEQMILLRSNQLYDTSDTAAYQTQFLSLDAYLTDLNTRYPFELGYQLMQNDIRFNALGIIGNPTQLATLATSISAQIARYPHLIDLQIMKSELLFCEGNRSGALALLNAQPPSVRRDGMRLAFLLTEGQTAQARVALSAFKRDWPSSDVRDSYVTMAEQQLK